MPRRQRIEGAGLIHHVTGHSHVDIAAFPDDTARRGFLTLLARAASDLHWYVLAYCLLSNHYHLVVQTMEANLGDGMRRLQGRHAQKLNARHARRGPVWRDRFHSRLVHSGLYVVRAAAYVDANPVSAGVCSAPESWRWSSYSANAGLVKPWAWHRPDLVYAQMGVEPAEAPAVYREIVADAVLRLRTQRTGD